MGNESVSRGKADGKSSLGNYSEHKTFGKAFNAAHAEGGSGHTFSYKDKLYTTDCADKGDYRKKLDNRSALEHEVRQKVHETDAKIKDSTGIHAQDLLSGRGYVWSSDVDR